MQRLLALAPFLLVACASDNFTTGANGEDAATETASGDTSVEPDTSVPGPDTGPCDPSEVANESETVFVATTGNDSAEGTASKPLLTIDAAITKAIASMKTHVRVAKGIYPVHLVLQAGGAGIVIEGGWNAGATTWTRNCASGARDGVLLSSPDRIGVTIEARTGNVVLRTLTIETRVASNAADLADSMIGVLARGAVSVLIDNVSVAATSAGNGPPATVSIGSTVPPCNSVSDCSDGANGGSGGTGSPGSAGSFSGTGYMPADGTAGAPGAPGHHGTVGGPGATANCFDCHPGVCISTTECKATVTATATPPGKCGCGGAGGSAGGPGHGGGASIALLAANGAKVTVQNSLLRAGNGGNGSPGKSGAPGAAGTSGSGGEGVSCVTSCQQYSGLTCVSMTTPYYCINGPSTVTSGGAPGGRGGSGGSGGTGGEGAGGPSYGIVTVKSGAVAIDGSSSIVHGSGGSGATNGAAADRFDP